MPVEDNPGSCSNQMARDKPKSNCYSFCWWCVVVVVVLLSPPRVSFSILICSIDDIYPFFFAKETFLEDRFR